MFNKINAFSELKEYTKRIFIFNGKTNDSFIMSDYRHLPFEKLLHEYLIKTLGYSSVAFVDHNGIFFWDTTSSINLMSPPAKKNSSNIKKGNSRLMKRKDGITTYQKNKKWDTFDSTVKLRYTFNGSSQEIMNSIINMLQNKEAGPVAVAVLTDELIFKTDRNDPVMVNFRGFLTDTLFNFDIDNQNIIILNSLENELVLSEKYLNLGLEKVFSCINDDAKITGKAAYMKILSGGRDETENLLARLRIFDKKNVDIKDKDQMSVFISSWIKEEDLDINNIYAKLKILEKLTMESLEKISGKKSELPAEKQLEKMTGMEKVKEQIKLNTDGVSPYVSKQAKYPERTGSISNIQQREPLDHFVLLGNPGTGKTTVARIIAKILQEKGILPIGHLIKAEPKDLIDQFVGGTAIKTRNLIDRALGGVLFIDEAYALCDGKDNSINYGKEALAVLVNAMTESRGELVIILAGYPKEMRAMIDTNPGMQRRVNIIEIPDYSDAELAEIMKTMIAEYSHEKEIENKTLNYVQNLMNNTQVDKNWGNAGEIEKIINEAKKLSKARTRGTVHLTAQDFKNPEFFEKVNLDNIPTIEKLVGLEDLKQQLKKIFSRVRAVKKQGKIPIPGHFIFQGNPGTGKTTVANIMAKEFYNMKLLEKPKALLKTASEFIGRHVGDAENNTREIFESALGGVLLIDEAHQFAGNDKDSAYYGKKVIETIVPLMENNREKISVIFAGYPEEMSKLFDIDKGLKGRFNFTIKFEDYSPQEMLEIFKIILAKNPVSLIYNNELENILTGCFEKIKTEEGRHFANGRSVRRFVDKLIDNYSYRCDNCGIWDDTYIIEDINQTMEEIINESNNSR